MNTDCTVVDIGQHTVYPIFKVGSSSLFAAADNEYVNQQIEKCKNIVVLIREPGDRFCSGLNEYCMRNNLDVEKTWQLVKDEKVIDRHFAPQYLWLVNLYRFYKGHVTLKYFDHINTITDIHVNKKKDNSKIVEVEPLEKFIQVDRDLMRWCNYTVQLGDLIKEHRYVLS